MAISNPVGLQFCVLLVVVLVPLTASFSSVSRQSKKANGIETATSDVEMGTANLQLYLPQLLSFAIKYRYAALWSIHYHLKTENTFCSKENNDNVEKCGITRLYDAIDNNQNSNGIDVNKALDKLCSYYHKFNRCLQEFHVRNCLLDKKVVVDLVYSYVCSDEARKDLRTHNTGQCLSALSVSSVMETIRENPNCNNIFTDLSSSVQMMVSQFRYVSSISNETPAVKTSLSRLCHDWHLQEKCLFPVYGQRCGNSAKSFYVGLLNHTKKTLADNYRRYGSDISELALCKMSVGKKSQNLPLTNVLLQYLTNQYTIWESAYDYQRQHQKDACDPIVIYNRLLMCFWKAISDDGHNFMGIIFNFASHIREILRSFQNFGHCYEDYVKDCPPENKVSFEHALQALRDITNNTENVVDCIGSMKLLHISAEKCGMTLTEIINYYLFAGSRMYDRSAIFRGSVSPEQDSISDIMSCMKQVATDSASSGDNPVCSDKVISQVRNFMDSLHDVIRQYDNFTKQI